MKDRMLTEMSNNNLGEMKPNSRLCFKTPIKWFNVFAMILLHIGALYGGYLMLTVAKIPTILLWFSYGTLASQGITAGAHRLWSHRAYKARLPLRILLAIFNCMSFQNDIYTWCRDHRVHHKFSDTDADPHNSQRGFFFAHVGWLLCKKTEAVKTKGKMVEFKDLLEDPVILWQRRLYLPLTIFLTFYLPTMIPVWYWQESLSVAFYVCLYRYCYQLHGTWLVNSVAHFYGMQQYDSSIPPRESALVVYGSFGEGYHNYHHVFPQDYSASELGWKYNFNLTTFFIDFCALIGQAYDLKKPGVASVKNRIERTGDQEKHEKVINEKMENQVRNMIVSTTIGFSHLWVPVLIRMTVMTLWR